VAAGNQLEKSFNSLYKNVVNIPRMLATVDTYLCSVKICRSEDIIKTIQENLTHLDILDYFPALRTSTSKLGIQLLSYLLLNWRLPCHLQPLLFNIKTKAHILTWTNLSLLKLD